MSHQARAHDLAFHAFQDLEISLRQLSSPARNTDWRASRLKEFFDENNGRIGCKLVDICRKLDLGVTASHASRLFRQNLGVGVREYQKLRRLHTAAERLRTTTMSVKEIAADLGYQTPADLFRQFKQCFHVTPLTFRSMSRRQATTRRIVA